MEDHRFLDYSIRSYNTSQFSAGDNSSISGNSVHLVDFDENFGQSNFSQELPNSIPNSNLVGKNQHEPNSNEQTENDSCKEVQCITEETGSSVNSRSNSQILQSRPQRYAESNISSPNANTSNSVLTEAENDDTETQVLSAPPVKDQTDMSLLHYDFIVPSPEKTSPWVSDVSSRSRSFSMVRSRSCRARLISSPPRFDKVEKNKDKGLPPMTPKKAFTRQFEGSQNIISAADAEKSARNSPSTSMCSDEYPLQSIASPIDFKNTASVSDLDAGMKHLVDVHLVSYSMFQ